MKKFFAFITAALLVCFMVFAMTSCGEADVDGVGAEKVTIGENGNWFVGSTDTGVKAAGTNVEIGDNGNWFFDGVDSGKKAVGADAEKVTIGENGNWFVGSTDTGVKAAGTNVEIGNNGNWFFDGVDSGKKAVGADAEKVTIGENGNWFIGTEDTGVKAVAGKYVVDVTTTTELDQKFGKRYVVTVITYSDGTTETQKNEIPEQIAMLYWQERTVFYAGYTPALYIGASTYHGDNLAIKITDDMYIGDKPDFNTPGTYNIMIVYGGRAITQTVEVLDATDVSVTGVEILNFKIRKGTPFSEVAVQVTFSDGSIYNVWLSDCDVTGIADFNKVGTFDIVLKYKGCDQEKFVDVYDPEVNNIYSVIKGSGGNFEVEIPLNADADTVEEIFRQSLEAGSKFSVNLYEEMYGTNQFLFTVTEDMIDLSTLDTSIVGPQIVKLTVNINGVGSYTKDIKVHVKEDLSNEAPVNTYTNDLLEIYGDLTLYDNGVAMFGDGGVQGNYTRIENTVTVTAAGMTMYFTVDDTANTYEPYAPEGAPTAVYVNEDGEMQVKVYSDCVVIGSYVPASGSEPEISIPICTMPASAIQDNVIHFMGQRILLYSDGTLDLVE